MCKCASEEEGVFGSETSTRPNPKHFRYLYWHLSCFKSSRQLGRCRGSFVPKNSLALVPFQLLGQMMV
jgi:hypothetical protein